MALNKLLRSIVGVVSTIAMPVAADAVVGGPDNAMPPRAIAVGYLPATRIASDALRRMPIRHYTHIDLAFANPASTGAFVDADAMACMTGPQGQALALADLRNAAATIRATGAKVLVSVGGGVIPTCSGDWAGLLRPETRARVVSNLVALVDRIGLDGVDVDLEGVLLTAIDREGNYVPFVRELRSALRARGKLLTCATASYEGGMIPIDAAPSFDLVNVMSYDAIGPGWGEAGTEQSTLATAQRDIDLWLRRGVARERLVLGVPFYGYGFGKYRASYSFSDIRNEFGADATRADVIGTACVTCDYVTFNGTETIRAKGRLARQVIGGVMVWEISQDTPDYALTRALVDLPED